MSQINEFKTEDEWKKAFPCLQSLRPNLDLSLFLKNRESLIARDYHLIGLTDGEKIVCVAGYVFHPHIERGSEFWIHDFATLPDSRSKGYGKSVIQHLEDLAKDAGCTRLLVHTKVTRDRAQNFYENKANLTEYAIVYSKNFE